VDGQLAAYRRKMRRISLPLIEKQYVQKRFAEEFGYHDWSFLLA